MRVEHGRRSWRDRWRTFVHHLQELQAVYAGTSEANNLGWEQTTRAVLSDGLHLRDHIGSDLGLRVEADAWVAEQPNLSIARDFANTDKHYRRSNPAHRTIHIQGTTGGFLGNAVSLSVHDPAAPPVTLDALAVATGCLSEWRTFLADHGIQEP